MKTVDKMMRLLDATDFRVVENLENHFRIKSMLNVKDLDDDKLVAQYIAILTALRLRPNVDKIIETLEHYESVLKEGGENVSNVISFNEYVGR